MKTYGELRQDAYFAAARALYDIAREAAQDVFEQSVPPSKATLDWIGNLWDTTFAKASVLEDLGHAETPATTRQNNQLYEKRALARAALARALDRANEPVKAP